MNAALRLLSWALAVGLIALSMMFIAKGWVGAQYWPLRTLRVQGELVRVDRAQLQTAVLPLAQRGFFAVDLKAVQSAVERVAWVEQVEVRKHWPDVLEVKVREYRPFAHWGEDKILSEHGHLFPKNKLHLPADMPLLDGPEGRVSEVVALYNQAQDQFAKLGGVSAVVIDKRGSWAITLHDGTQLVLGRNDPDNRLARFAPMLPQLLAQDPTRRVVRADLRYTNGFALTWGKVETTTNSNGSNT